MPESPAEVPGGDDSSPATPPDRKRSGRQILLVSLIALVVVAAAFGALALSHGLDPSPSAGGKKPGPPALNLGGQLVLANGSTVTIPADSFVSYWFGTPGEFEFYGVYGTTGDVAAYLLTVQEHRQLSTSNASSGQLPSSFDGSSTTAAWIGGDGPRTSIDAFIPGGYYALVFVGSSPTTGASVHVTATIQANSDLD